jgi:hypothetical protein
MIQFTKLQPEKIIDSVSILEKRISDRFPDSGLKKVCHEFLVLSERTKTNILYISKPNIPLKVFSYLLIILGVGGVVFSFSVINLKIKTIDIEKLISLSNGVLNNLFLIGAAFLFLVTMESRIKRKRALKSLHNLRVIAHVIDMHQLTKDPYISNINNTTENSPVRLYTKFELQRYLDYCSEASALIGKVAALYAQSLPDPVIVGSVNEIEVLTTGLSRKIWQKIVVLQNLNT